MTDAPNRAYLGDGVYVDFDGWQFRLWTDRESGTAEIFLEPEVYASLERYVAHIVQKQSADETQS